MTTDIERANHNENRKRIGQDIICLGEIISEVDENQDENFKVLDGNYLDVWLTEEVVSMNHEEGSFMYCRRLKERLERVVEDDIVDWDLLIDPHSPYHLKRFLDFNIQRYSK